MKTKKILLALFFAGLSAGATYCVYSHRDFLFEWGWAKGQGKFSEAADEKLRIAARDFAEAKHPGRVCVDKWLGKDEKYVYMTIGCALFRETLGEVRAEGDENFAPARLRYSGEKIESMEQPAPDAFTNSLHRIFPKEAADKMRGQQSRPEFYRRGLLRMAERGLSTMRQ